MDKKADWKESLKEALKDKRLLGAGLAGIAGAAVGGGVLPGLIYKKPTWGSRFWMGGASGISTFLIALAAMQAAGSKNQDKSLAGKGKGALATGKALLQSTFGADKSKAQLREMGAGQKAVWGLPGTGVPGWLARRWHESKPKQFLATTLGLGAGGLTWAGSSRLAQNWNRARQFKELLLDPKNRQLFTDPKLAAKISELQQHSGGLTDLYKALKAKTVLTGKHLPFVKNHISTSTLKSALKETTTNPFLFTEGIVNSAKSGKLPANNILGRVNRSGLELSERMRQLAMTGKGAYKLPAARGIGGKALRLGRRALPAAAFLLVSGLFNNNDSYHNLINQDLYSDLNK